MTSATLLYKEGEKMKNCSYDLLVTVLIFIVVADNLKIILCSVFMLCLMLL